MSNGSVLQTMTVTQWLAIPILLVLSGLLTLGRADTFGDFTYFANGSTAGITKYNGPGGNIIIPDSILGKKVTSIGAGAFFGCIGVTNVTIPDSVSVIGIEAFYSCSGLTEVTLPGSLNYIGNYAFFCCSNLAHVRIPNGVTNIGMQAFFSCNSLTNVTIPKAVTSIGNTAFMNCSSLSAITVDSLNTAYSSVDGVLFNKSHTLLICCPAGKAGNFTVPEGVTILNSSSFYGCASLTNVTISSSVTNILTAAFSGCANLTRLTIPKSVIKIGDSAFSHCAALQAVYFEGNSYPLSYNSSVFLGSDQVTVYYRAGAKGWGSTYGGRPTALWVEQSPITDFTYTTNATSATITGYTGPGGNVIIPDIIEGKPVTSIGNSAFRYSTNLTGITMPTSVITIGESAFEACRGLTNATIPNGVVGILRNAFSDCTGLTYLNIPASVTNIDGYVFYKCTDLMSITVDNSNPVYFSKDGVLFDKSQNLVQYPLGVAGDYSIPDGISAIMNGAFAGCAGLTNIYIPNSVTNIGSYEFVGCSSLLSVSIPNGIRNLGFSMFADCSSLTNVDIPASVINLGINTFSGCSSLITISVDPLNTAYSSIDGVLFNKDQTVLYQFPAANTANYIIPDSVAQIWGSAFLGSTRLESVKMPGSVTALGTTSFYGCTNLTNVLISGHVTTLQSNVFANCSRLADLAIPYGITTIGQGAFSGCASLTNVAIPSSVTKLDKYAFGSCTSLSSIKLPNSVLWLDGNSFSGCSNLTDLYFEGNPPRFPGPPNYLNINIREKTVYYNAGITGWGSSYGGVPTAPISDPGVRGFAFKQNATTTTITGYVGSGGALTIPLTILGLPVAAIGDLAFADRTNLTSVIIPGSVTNIIGGAFAGCSNLTSVTISNSATLIDGFAFYGCTRLTGVYFNGNAPTNVAQGLFDTAPNVTVYYRAGTTGWGTKYAGRPTALWVEQSPITDFTYTTNDVSATITGYTGPGGNVTIPDAIGGKPVTIIGNNAFRNCTNLTGITIPNSVTNIGAYVFFDCGRLTEVVIPNSVTSLGSGAFGYCYGLTNVTLSNGITNIMDSMFSDCSGLGNITLPDSVTSIGYDTFRNCSNLTGVNIPNSVTNIGKTAFLYCTSLTNIALPSSVVQIGYSIFGGCNNLTTISVDTLNPAYSSIDGVLFTNNQSILLAYPPGKEGEYVVPATVKSIDNAAVRDCLELTGVTLPEGITNIGPSAFYGCTKLAHINLPDSVTFIDQSAFYRCTSLTNIVIPGSAVISFLSSYGANVFARCSSLTNITVAPANTNYSSLDGVLFNKSQSTLLQFPGGKTGSYMIPLTVTAIRESAFAGCAGLTGFSVPTNSIFSTLDGVLFNKNQTTLIACPAGKTGSYSITNEVNKLGGYAFSDCSGLTNISIPQTITTISSNAFYNCTGLTSIIIPNRANVIMDSAFHGCVGLTSITIPASVGKIESYAFEACSNLTGVYFEGNAPNVIMAYSPFLDADLATIYYRSGTTGWGTKYAGRPTALWVEQSPISDFTYTTNATSATITKYIGPGGSVTIPDAIGGKQVVAIGGTAFMNCGVLTGIIIPNGVHSIGDSAFFMCRNLTSLVMGSGVTNILGSAFASCSNLTSVEIPNSVMKIGTYAFADCTALTNLTISTGVSSIDEKAFVGCTKLTAIEVDTQNTNYSSNDGILFDKSQSTLIQCPAGRMGDYVIPGTVSAIGISAFDSCWGVTNVTVPGSVTSLGDDAFFKATRLTGVYFQGNAPTPVPKYLFSLATNVTVYYRAGTTGWGSTFAGRPTALWVEQPTYQQWAQTVGLLDKFPDASAETDDADQDGMRNLAEMQAGTDPTNPNSKLAFESVARPNDLADEDKSAIGSDQHPLFFQTVPGRKYEIQSVTAFGGVWQTETNVTATTTQKRVLIDKPVDQGFYRIVLAPLVP